MKDITVDKAVLVGRIKANLDTHRDTFLRAQAAYRLAVIKAFEQRLAEARDHGRINTHFSFPVPEDHSNDYRRALEMLDMELGDTVTLDETDFAQYVQDDWGWKRQWTGTTASYLVE